MVWRSAAACRLPRTRPPATRVANLRGEMHDVPVGMSYGGRNDRRSVESQKTALSNRDLLLRSSLLPPIPIRTTAQGSGPSWNDVYRGRLGGQGSDFTS